MQQANDKGQQKTQRSKYYSTGTTLSSLTITKYLHSNINKCKNTKGIDLIFTF